MSDIPTLFYFPLRGRGETLRLTLSLKNIEWHESVPEYSSLKATAGSSEFPFGQLPTMTINGFHLAQSDAILRHLGRMYGLYGETLEEHARVDEALLGVESIRTKYVELVYMHSFSDEAKKKYAADHIAKESVNTRNGGAHFAYLEGLLVRNGGDFLVGKSVSIADIQLFDMVDLHLRQCAFPDEIRSLYPSLVSHHDRIAAIPQIHAYLNGPKRCEKVNGNGLG